MKAVITWASIVIWMFHVVIGAGAGYATIRLWEFRTQPLIMRLGLFLTGYVVETLSAVVLLFLARGVRFTLKFTAVMFGLMLVSDLLRVWLILYLIKGPDAIQVEETSGSKEPDYWRREFREAIREELKPLLDLVHKIASKLKT